MAALHAPRHRLCWIGGGALPRPLAGTGVIIFVTTLFVSVPSFILATILLLVFCLQLQWVGVWSPSNPNYVLPVIALALLSHGLYHPSDQIQHARRAGTGLHPHRPRQGRA